MKDALLRAAPRTTCQCHATFRPSKTFSSRPRRATATRSHEGDARDTCARGRRRCCPCSRSLVLPQRPGRLGVQRPRAARRVSPESRATDRRVGKLFSQPQYRCDCGARVLDLLVLPDLRRPVPWRISRDGEPYRRRHRRIPACRTSRTSRICPSKRRSRETQASYLVYWPRTDAPADETWTRDNGRYSFEFRRSVLRRRQDVSSTKAAGATGWSFHVVAEAAASAELVPPFPNGLSGLRR